MLFESNVQIAVYGVLSDQPNLKNQDEASGKKTSIRAINRFKGKKQLMNILFAHF